MYVFCSYMYKLNITKPKSTQTGKHGHGHTGYGHQDLPEGKQEWKNEREKKKSSCK